MDLTYILDTYLINRSRVNRALDKSLKQEIETEIEKQFFEADFVVKDLRKMCSCRSKHHNMLILLKRKYNLK